MKKTIITCMAAAVTCLSVLIPWHQAGAEGTASLTPAEYEKVSRGGMLYDKWYASMDVKPEGTHPSYPEKGQKKGESTWRCKECHGWDYKGKDGAYSTGSHFTGIMGIMASAGKERKEIAAVLGNDTHAFGEMIPPHDLEALTYFIAYGLTDMDRSIDRSSKKATGDINKGEIIYASTCVKCHGSDGRKLNFKTPEDPEYLGTVASKNPWETLHKIRYGQPASEMPALLFLDIREQTDVLSYCQTLPVK